MIDLRSKVKKLLDNGSHYVLLQRNSKTIHCYCWNEIAQESNPNCPSCMGTGWVSVIERHRTRYDSAIQIEAKPNLSILGGAGRSWIDALTMYFEHFVYPGIDDFVYEVEWDVHNSKKPVKLLRAYRVNDVFTQRGKDGRIEFYSVSVKAEITKTQMRNVIIRNMGAIENYQFTE